MTDLITDLPSVRPIWARLQSPFPGARIQGVWMVLIRLVTQMLEMRADAELEKVADRCLRGDHETSLQP